MLNSTKGKNERVGRMMVMHAIDRQEIEEAFGCTLFERQSRGMRATVLGEELLRFARAALNGLERCAEDLADRQAGGYGYLSVGAIMVLSSIVICISGCSVCDKVPLGPFTVTRFLLLIVTSTPLGTVIGAFPMRDMFSCFSSRSTIPLLLRSACGLPYR